MKSNARMTAEDIFSRINGISIWGISWEPIESHIKLAQEVIAFMEDRRVLFNDYELEVPRYCVESVQEIRRFLTDILRRLDNKPGFPQHLRMMRSACRQFLDKVQDGQHQVIYTNAFEGGPRSWTFCTALGAFRHAMGQHLGIVAARCGLGMEGELATILPAPPEPADDAE